MAIFRAETKHISRSKKDNVVSAAAYRSGEKLTDTNKFNPDAKTHDYTRKQGVMAKGIILPSSLIEQNFTIGRQQLWSSVEQHETTTRSVKGSRLKQTARLAREWLLALPTELSDEENEQLTAEFTQRLADDLGVIGDYCIHKPTVGNYKPKADYIESYDLDTEELEKTRVYDLKATEPDSRNIHAHIMFTTRKVELDNGSLVFGKKADSERSEKWRQEKGLSNGGDYLKEIRHLWADMVNERLEQKHILPITAKSYKDLGINIIPQQKQGKDASTLALYGFKPPIVGHNNDFREQNRAYIKSAADRCIAINNDTAGRADNWTKEASDWLSRAAPTPFDTKRRTERLGEQSIVFDRFAERTSKLIKRAVGLTEKTTELLTERLAKAGAKKYDEIRFYEPMVQLSDWLGSREPIPNPEPDPSSFFNKRQLDVIANISEYIEGHDDDYISYSKLKECLKNRANDHILMLLTDPKKEQLHYEQNEKERVEQKNLNDFTLDIEQKTQTLGEQQEIEQKPQTPQHTYAPR